MPSLLASFITDQSGHETDGWTSAIFVDCNNGFGYKWIGQSTALGPCSKHPAYAAYSSIEQSTHEMILWIKRRQADGSFPADLNQIKTPYDYAYLLKYGSPFYQYYEDPLEVYEAGLIRFANSLNLTAVAAGGGGVIVLGLFVWLFRRKLFGSKS